MDNPLHGVPDPLRDYQTIWELKADLPNTAKSPRRWRKLLKAVRKNKDVHDLELLRSVAQEIHDPWFLPHGRDGGWIGPQIEELVHEINGRLRDLKAKPPAPSDRREPPGMFQGQSHRVTFQTAMDLKRAKMYAPAAGLLESAIGALEAEVYAQDGVLLSDYYLQLAIVQRAQGDTEGEVRTLERYLREAQRTHQMTTAIDKMQERLARLRANLN